MRQTHSFTGPSSFGRPDSVVEGDFGNHFIFPMAIKKLLVSGYGTFCQDFGLLALMVLCASVSIFCVKLVAPIRKISFVQLIPAHALAFSDLVRWDQELA